MLLNLKTLNREINYLPKLTQAEIEYLSSLIITKEIAFIIKNNSIKKSNEERKKQTNKTTSISDGYLLKLY